MSTANETPDGKPLDIDDPATDESLSRIIVPLTVVYTHVQLLRRKIERGQQIEHDDLRKAVGQMETATRAVVDGIRAYEASTPRTKPWENPGKLDGSQDDSAKGDTGQMTIQSPREEGARATPEQMDRKHVFVVNGSPEFLDIVRQLLQDENYNVTTTNFVPRSFETIEVAQPSLLIIDLVIGEQAGWDLLARLRNAISTQDIPVLLVSTRPALLDKAKEKHEEFGGDSYLTKPFDLDDLLDHIERLIGKA